MRPSQFKKMNTEKRLLALELSAFRKRSRLWFTRTPKKEETHANAR